MQHAISPANHFWIQRLAGAGADAQLVGYRRHRFFARGHQQAVSGRRSCEVRDLAVEHDANRRVDREATFVKSRRVAEQEWANDRVEHAIGPAGIGDVPISILRLEVDSVDHVGGDRQQQRQRIANALGLAGRARSEQHDERIRPLHHHGCKVGGLRREHLGEAFADEQRWRAIGQAIELGQVGRIGDDQLGLAAAGGGDPTLDSRRPESGEQGLVERANAPGAENDREQIGNARQQASDHVAGADASALEVICEARAVIAHLFEGDRLAVA